MAISVPWRSFLLSAATMIVLAACSSAQGPTRAEPDAVIPSNVDVLILTLPLDAYLPDPAEKVFVKRAEQILFQRCMRRFGWELTLPPPLIPMPFKTNERRYGVSVERATQYGYHTPELEARSAAGMAGEPELSDEAYAVADGTIKQYSGSDVPVGGCHGEANALLAEGSEPVADTKLAEKLASIALSTSREDSRVRRAFGEWSACMERSGYAYQDPMAAIADPAFRTPTVTAAEFQTSVADAKCKKETRLVEIWAGVEAAYQAEAVEANSVALRAISNLEKARSRNAAGVLEAAQ